MKITTSFILALLAATGLAAEPVTALEACKALPKAQQKFIARLAGRGGKPLPEVWTIVVHDPAAQNGLKEYTVTSGVVVASRGISDLAARITEGDVIGLPGIKFDATQVAELAASYAEANHLAPASLNYELRKDGQDAAPLWKIAALDEAGDSVGELVITANTGTLINQTGFPNAPAVKDLAGITDAEPLEEAGDEKPDKPTRSTTKTSGSSSSSTRKKPSTARRIGGHLQKFFTGKNTIGR